jgi:hypothetical protein
MSFLTFSQFLLKERAKGTVNAEFAKVRAKVDFLPELWSAVITQLPAHQIQTIRSLGRWTTQESGSQFDVNTYIMEIAPYATRPWRPRFTPTTHFEEELLEGARSWMNCSISAGFISKLLKKVLAGDPDIGDIEWRRVRPKPRFVLFCSHQLVADGDNGHGLLPPIPFHDVIVIRCTSGNAYLVDLTGAQFGFRGWFFELEYYKRRYTRFPTPEAPIMEDEDEGYSAGDEPSADELQVDKKVKRKTRRKARETPQVDRGEQDHPVAGAEDSYNPIDENDSDSDSDGPPPPCRLLPGREYHSWREKLRKGDISTVPREGMFLVYVARNAVLFARKRLNGYDGTDNRPINEYSAEEREMLFKTIIAFFAHAIPHAMEFHRRVFEEADILLPTPPYYNEWLAEFLEDLGL